MKYTSLCVATLILSLLVTGCGRNNNENNDPETDALNDVAIVSPTESPTPVETKTVTAPIDTVKKIVEKPAEIVKTVQQPKAFAAKPSTKEPAASSNAVDLDALAKASGCFACHSIDKKVIGPAWKDVAQHYKDDLDAKTKLLAKVKKGGAGNWTSVTGGMPMPPYSPRVSDENLELLVDFVLSLQ